MLLFIKYSLFISVRHALNKLSGNYTHMDVILLDFYYATMHGMHLAYVSHHFVKSDYVRK